MTPAAQSDEITAYFDPVAKLATAVIPVSFVIGLAALAGRCFAIGGSALSLVGFTDVVAAATKAAPIALIYLALVAIGVVRYATASSAATHIADRGKRIINFLEKIRRIIWVLGIVIPVGAAIFLDWQSVVVFGSLFAAMAMTLEAAAWSARSSRMPTLIVLLALIVASTFATAAISFTWTTLFLRLLPQQRQTYVICTDVSDPKKCEYGLIVARFSEVTLFRGNDEKLSYIANSEIKRVRAIDKETSAIAGK